MMTATGRVSNGWKADSVHGKFKLMRPAAVAFAALLAWAGSASSSRADTALSAGCGDHENEKVHARWTFAVRGAEASRFHDRLKDWGLEQGLSYSAVQSSGSVSTFLIAAGSVAVLRFDTTPKSEMAAVSISSNRWHARDGLEEV